MAPRFENGKTYKLEKQGREFDVLVRYYSPRGDSADVTFWPGTPYQLAIGGHGMAFYTIIEPKKTTVDILNELPVGGRFRWVETTDYIKIGTNKFVCENYVDENRKTPVYSTISFEGSILSDIEVLNA